MGSLSYVRKYMTSLPFPTDKHGKQLLHGIEVKALCSKSAVVINGGMAVAEEDREQTARDSAWQKRMAEAMPRGWERCG